MRTTIPNLALLSCTLLCTLGGPQNVHAHLGDLPAGIEPFYQDGLLVGAATNLGLVVMREDIPTWYTQFRVHGDIYWYSHTGDERVVVGTSQGMLETTDWGCSWAYSATGVPTVAVPAMVFDQSGERPALVGTADPAENNYLYESFDGGATWQRIDESMSNDQFLGLTRAPGGSAVAALSHGAGGTRIHSRLDAGAAWDAREVSLRGDSPLLLGVSPDGSVVYVGTFEGEVIETPSDEGEDAPPSLSYEGISRLYAIETGGDVVNVLDVMEDLVFDSGVVALDGTLWTTDSEDILRSFGVNGDIAEQAEIGHCVRFAGLQGLLTCGQRPQEYAFFGAGDDGEWEGFLLFDGIVGELCPDKPPAEDEDDSITQPDEGDSQGENPSDEEADTADAGGDLGSIGKDDMLGDSSSGVSGDGNVTGENSPKSDSGCSQIDVSLWYLVALSAVRRRRRRRVH
ncbi:MAG: hypothetical protein VX834_10630 [Myxococcota bacterium]|nr:hypothetical protein [Myxococcota bacterium]